jgi:signal transduction histidine kinase
MDKGSQPDTQLLRIVASGRAFLINLCQELIRPLNVILGYTEIWREVARRSGRDKIASGIFHIRTPGKRLLSIVNGHLGDRVEIRIRDNGLGIAPDAREKIFNPSSQPSLPARARDSASPSATTSWSKSTRASSSSQP